MTATLTKLKTHFVNWREWELNPVVIKELRQAVRSWAVTGMLMLFLIVLFVTSLIFLVNQSFEVSANERLGGDIFQTFTIILAGASILFIPLYVGVRMAAERQENNTDLLYISTLSPMKVIRGKFFCGAYMTLLFFSACMPFMAFTNLLRGVDLPTVFAILAFLFVVVCSANQLAIFIACLPLSRTFKILIGIGGFFMSFWLIGAVIIGAIGLMRSGIGSMMGERYFWLTTLTIASMISAVGGLLFVLSVALISPPSANRARLPRFYLTTLWLFGGLLAGGWAFQTKEPMIIFSWTYFSTALLVASLVVTVSNHDRLSVRVRRTIPARGLKRMLAFSFFNGAAGGLLWVATLVVLTFLGTVEYITMSKVHAVASFSGGARGYAPPENLSSFLEVYPPVMIYIFAYALTALFIQRKFLPRHSPKLAGIFTLLVASVAAFGPSIVLFFLNQLSWNTLENLQLGNASNLFVVHESGSRRAHLYFAGGWLLVALVLNGKWFVTQIKNFRPPPTSVPPPLN